MNDKIAYKREHFETLPSTNDYLKDKRREMLANGEGKTNYIVTAAVQTGGRGTKGRSFVSDAGGLYLSALTFYENFKAKDAFSVMAGAAVAVCETLRFYGLSSVIKWANDVYVNDKKICGILIENVFSGENISSSIVGIGLNVNNVLPDSLKEIATTMQELTGRNYDVGEVGDRLILELSKSHSMREYLSYIGYMGREVALLIDGERVHGRLVFVDDTGGLHVEIDGKARRLTVAEVSFAIGEDAGYVYFDE